MRGARALALFATLLSGCTQEHPLAISVIADALPEGAQWSVRVVPGACASAEQLAGREPVLAAPFVPGEPGELGRIAPGRVAVAVTASSGCSLELFGCVEASVPTAEVVVRVESPATDERQDVCRAGELCELETGRCVRQDVDDAGCTQDGGCGLPPDAGPLDAGSPDAGSPDAGPPRTCSTAADCGPTDAFTCDTFCEARAAQAWVPRAITLDEGGPVQMSDVALEVDGSALHVLVPWELGLAQDVARVSGPLGERGRTLAAPTSLAAPFVLDGPRQVAAAWDSASDEVWFAIADETTVAFGFVAGLSTTQFAGMFGIANARPGPGPAPMTLEPLILTAGGPRAFADTFYPIRFVFRIDSDTGLTSSDFGANPGTFRWVDGAGYDGSPLVASDSRYVLFADAAGAIRLWDSDAPGADDTASGPPLTVLLQGEARRPALYTRLAGDVEHTELVHLVGAEARVHRLACTDEAGCAASASPNGTFEVPADARLLAARAMTEGAVVAYLTGASTVELRLVSRAARVVATHRLELPGAADITELRLRVRARANVTDVVVAALDMGDAGDQVWLTGLSFEPP